MNKTRIGFILILALTGGLLWCAGLNMPNPSEKRKAIIQVLVTGIEAEHYKPVPVGDSLSARIYSMYLKRLNYSKMFFTKSDMEQLEKYKYHIDSAIKYGSFDFYDFANAIVNKRIGEDSDFIRKTLDAPFDFTKKEYIETDEDKIPIPADTSALHELIRQDLKYRTLVNLVDKLNKQEKTENKGGAPNPANILNFAQLKYDSSAAKKIKDTAHVKTFAELEKESRSTIQKYFNNLFKEMSKQTEEDKLNFFFATIANTFDPHTEYLAPEARKSFDIQMSGQLEGIGAQLSVRNGNITIDRVIPGSPAWKSGEIKEGDVILKVAQGMESAGDKKPEGLDKNTIVVKEPNEAVDVEGMQLGKAVSLIRGKKGTGVTLTIRKINNTEKVVSLIRDVIHLEETYAKDAIIDNVVTDDEKKIGYIRLPEFYTDFEGPNGKNCANDVKEEVNELKAEGVKGIIIDLRDNGGGSLNDVVNMVGIFIPGGPVVQVRSRQQSLRSMGSHDTAADYTGPLLVMVNGYSASASEIFAAAIQDYHRGVILGSPTYGKGTVQEVYNMDDKLSGQYDSLKPLGSVKITVSKFYRITGASTQHDGVIPDILLPDPYIYEKEKNADYSLNWDKITPADYRVWKDAPAISELRAKSAKRVKGDTLFQLINDEVTVYKKQHDKTQVPLNLVEYKEKLKEQNDEDKKFASLSKPRTDMGVLLPLKSDGKDSLLLPKEENNTNKQLTFNSTNKENLVTVFPPQKEYERVKVDTNERNTEVKWLKNLTRDPELFEALRIVNDMN